eukprot:1695809-Rhodomonas_salina.1
MTVRGWPIAQVSTGHGVGRGRAIPEDRGHHALVGHALQRETESETERERDRERQRVRKRVRHRQGQGHRDRDRDRARDRGT